jgi:hypothetical protein
VKIFLAKHGVADLSHPPYSPDLTSPEFSLSFGENCPQIKLVSGCWRH